MSNKIERMGENRGSGRFQKGASGNPGGRPSFSKYVKEAGLDPSTIGVELVATAIKWMRDGHPKLASHAHQWLSDHLLGKPKEHVTVDSDSTGLALIVAARMTPFERAQKLAELDAESGDSTAPAESDVTDEG